MSESASLRFLYNNPFGRLCLKVIKRRWLSRLCGCYLNSRCSKHLIKRFVRNNNIDLSQYYADGFKCFNDCFCRQIREEFRPIDNDPAALVSPCDGLLTVYRIGEGAVMQASSSRLEPIWKKSQRRATFTWNGAKPSISADANS